MAFQTNMITSLFFTTRWSRKSWTTIQKSVVKKLSYRADEQPRLGVDLSSGLFLVTDLSLTWGLGTSRTPQNLYYLVNLIYFPWLAMQEMTEPVNRGCRNLGRKQER
ncbi:hypothetical protein OIU84_030167 [Salix udensis]|uniref:Uncharacterized protein n=1 Tax=Salix udensis TaxID=889485 RepID=A0AAD6KAY0_9ROSI|nr:hypothetical protein OIU84_030167 [Salix udensis]